MAALLGLLIRLPFRIRPIAAIPLIAASPHRRAKAGGARRLANGRSTRSLV